MWKEQNVDTDELVHQYGHILVGKNLLNWSFVLFGYMRQSHDLGEKQTNR